MFELIVYEEGLLPFFRCNFDRCALISGRDWKRRVPGPERPLESQIRRESARPLLAEMSCGLNLENLYHKRKISRHAPAIRDRGTPPWR